MEGDGSIVDQIEDVVAAVAATENKEKQGGNSCSVYELRTIRADIDSSRRRLALLPSYPLGEKDKRPALLLLPNVPNVDRDLSEEQSFRGGICPFTVTQHRFDEGIDSFMIQLYRDIFFEPSQRWKIEYNIIDYNLSRLRKCMNKYTEQTGRPAMLSMNELPMALEFFLQIDVDLFYMKTCNFRNAQPRLFGSNKSEPEGIFCQTTPAASYGMMACFRDKCFLCQPWRQQQGQGKGTMTTAVQFSENQVHRFVNRYLAILNCHANCDTSNVIYVLTCPCRQCDFIGSTSGSFYDRMSYHREEGNRIVREFLIGSNNIEHMLKQAQRSDETLANNSMFLYQHSPRCPLVLQRFLNNNPEYWCLVPMQHLEAKADDDALASLSSSTNITMKTTSRHREQQMPALEAKPMFFAEVMGTNRRSNEESIWLAKTVPKPYTGYRFSQRQIQEQIDFFKYKKETHVRPSNLVDLYDYAIVGVLPDDCSNELRRFIEALFITHVETSLNTIGRLTHEGAWPNFDFSNRGHWCEKLVRHLSL